MKIVDATPGGAHGARPRRLPEPAGTVDRRAPADVSVRDPVPALRGSVRRRCRRDEVATARGPSGARRLTSLVGAGACANRARGAIADPGANFSRGAGLRVYGRARGCRPPTSVSSHGPVARPPTGRRPPTPTGLVDDEMEVSPCALRGEPEPDPERCSASLA